VSLKHIVWAYIVLKRLRSPMVEGRAESCKLPRDLKEERRRVSRRIGEKEERMRVIMHPFDKSRRQLKVLLYHQRSAG
jgi:hypothetical protein